MPKKREPTNSVQIIGEVVKTVKKIENIEKIKRSVWFQTPVNPKKTCEHGKYLSVCTKHPKIFARGLSDDAYQQLLNIKAFYRLKYGLATWGQVLEQMAKELSKKDWI